MSKRIETRTAGPSIADVAREAGVATSTVSRALTMPGRIAEPTRLKVEAAAQKLGYTGNQTARNLRVGTPRTIMIVLPEEVYIGASQIVSEVLRSTAKALTDRGFSLLIANVSREAETDAHILSVALGGTVAGVLLMATNPPEAGGQRLMDAGLPIVSLHFDLTSALLPSVVCNDHDAIYDATVRLLRDYGHRRLLYIRGRPNNYHDIERLRGVRAAVAAAGLGEQNLQLAQGDYSFSGGIAAARDMLLLPDSERPTLVVCANDDTAIGFMKTMLDAGIDVPGKISVLGFDGAAVAPFMTPSLSTIRQDTLEMGSRAANLLTDMVLGESNGAPTRIEVPCTIVFRDSVGPAPEL